MKHILTAIIFNLQFSVIYAQIYRVDKESKSIYVFTTHHPAANLKTELFNLGFISTVDSQQFTTNWTNFPKTILKHQLYGIITQTDTGYITTIRAYLDNSVAANIYMQSFAGVGLAQPVQVPAQAMLGGIHWRIYSRMLLLATALSDTLWFETGKPSKCVFDMKKIEAYRKP